MAEIKLYTPRVSARDLEVLHALARFPFANIRQLAQLVYGEFTEAGRVALTRRLPVLEKLGLVERNQLVYDIGVMAWISREGLRFIGETGEAPAPRWSNLMHDFQLTDLVISMCLDYPDWQVITEREIRRSEHEWQFDATTIDGKPKRAIPDLVTVGESGAWAHEFEYSRKSHRRLVLLMLGYAHAAQYRGARYYATAELLPAVSKAVEEANNTAEKRGLGRPIAVTQWPKEREDKPNAR